MGRYQPKIVTVTYHQNLAELDHINKWNNLRKRVFIQLLDLYEEPLLVQIANTRGFNVVIYIYRRVP